MTNGTNETTTRSIARLKAYVRELDDAHRFTLESGEWCVVLTAPVCDTFHEWHYYLLLQDEKLRVVRRHKILPDVYPTRVITPAQRLTKDDAAIVRHVAEHIENGQLTAMPDCNKA